MTSGESAAAQSGFLARAMASTSGNAAVERIRSRGSEPVLALYRLVKIGLIHAAENDAVGQLLDQTLSVLHEFSGLAGGWVVITFVDGTVFVCGQLVRASRAAFDSATELGEMLLRCGVSELRFAPELTRGELHFAAQAIASALRDGSPTRLAELSIPTIAMLKQDALVSRRKDDSKKGERRSLGYYASALVVMRRFFDELAAGTTVLPYRVKRIAQGLVGLAETEGAGLLGLTALANAHRDDAGRALQSAILAIAIAREMTVERPLVARIAMAALLADVGRVRLAGQEGRDRLVPLAPSVDREVPPMTSAVSLAVGGVNAQSALHMVIVHEATWLERQAELGPLYGGAAAPLLQSRILQVARAALDLLAPRDNSRGVAVLDALSELTRNPTLDRGVLRLLVKAVGITPVGSVVELDSGAWAVVAAPSRNSRAHDRPVVRVVMDHQGRVVEPPEEWDLGAPPEGARYPRIARLVTRDEARFNVARAVV